MNTHENTHMAVLGQDYSLLIDCVSNPVVRLPKAGIDINRLTDMVLTHFHPDHVSGVPAAADEYVAPGRKSPLNIYGLHHTLNPN